MVRRILTLIIVILLLLNLYSTLLGTGSISSKFTFERLLYVFQDAPDVVTPVRDWLHLDSWKITSDWGPFNFVREFINLFIDILHFLNFIVMGLVQLIVYVHYFSTMLFFG